MPRAARLLLSAALLATAGWTFVSLGHILHHEDALGPADAIIVLGGPRLERVVEAGDLYREGWAPRIVLSRPFRDGGELALAARGIGVPSEVDIQRNALIAMGVAPDAIEAFIAEQTTTATEGDEIYAMARARNWSRLVVVTSKLHTTRARLTLARRFKGTTTQILMRASRHDRADIDRWWANRNDLRFAVFEAQRLAAYWVGFAD